MGEGGPLGEAQSGVAEGSSGDGDGGANDSASSVMADDSGSKSPRIKGHFGML